MEGVQIEWVKGLRHRDWLEPCSAIGSSSSATLSRKNFTFFVRDAHIRKNDLSWGSWQAPVQYVCRFDWIDRYKPKSIYVNILWVFLRKDVHRGGVRVACNCATNAQSQLLVHAFGVTARHALAGSFA